jgi:hypothetical protein
MPNGKWVAFEGYDTLHKCGSKLAKSSSKSHPQNQSDNDSDRDVYDDLEFPDIEVGSRPFGKSKPHPASRRDEGEAKPEVQSSHPVIREPVFKSDRGIPDWVWWVVFAIAVIWVFGKIATPG